ncbi:hypothetical protein BHE74_00030588 [Ensete ventricosum]|nr:hypothetical protein GW17_00033748 [Ensete ventricosum]RWW62280.1 hypothetical protein BHE74_00030588 [Ensete ventricosum]
MAGLCVTGDGASVGATGDRTRTKKDEDEDPVEVYYTDGKEEGKKMMERRWFDRRRGALTGGHEGESWTGDRKPRPSRERH